MTAPASPTDPSNWHARIKAVKEGGIAAVADAVIGNWLTEINVTSPTGLQQINRFDGVSLEAQIWDRIEVRYQESRRTWP